jgi:thiamine-monophosphate kinase
MKVKELGEFGLIERLAARAARAGASPPGRFPLVLGIGDDAAAWRADGALELCTTDTMVEGVHFTLEAAPFDPDSAGTQDKPWRDLGWKALAVNLSDIAAMGGTPLYAIVTLGLPDETEVEALEALYDGMLECGAEFGGTIVGGDVVRSPVLFISVALTGSTPGGLLTRSGARAGDQVAVTGALGASGAWLAARRRGQGLEPEVAAALGQAHLRPRPRLAQGQKLLAAGVRCAMDISDGLVSDLQRVCQASGVAARLEAECVPVHAMVSRAMPEEALPLALGGGEDYELLFTAPTALMKEVLGQLPGGATAVGQIVPVSGSGQGAGPLGLVELRRRGRPMELASGGWDHFRR